MIYLASPYTHPAPAVRLERYHAVCRAAAGLIRAGCVVFSPIAHSHAITEHGLPVEWSFWERQDREHLRRCDELLVLKLAGWRDSAGVQAEVALAWAWGKPVGYLEPSGDETSLGRLVGRA